VDQAELRIEEVVIEDPLLSVSTDELGPLRARHECEGRTGFLSAEDADEPLGDALVADEVLGPFVLAELAGAIQVCAAFFSRPFLGMLDQTIGVLGCHGFHEVAAANFQNAIDETFEFAGSRQGQMAFEEDTVEAMQGANDEAGELDQKAPRRTHGILPRLVEVPTNHSEGRTPFFP